MGRSTSAGITGVRATRSSSRWTANRVGGSAGTFVVVGVPVPHALCLARAIRSEWERLFRAEHAALRPGDRVVLDGLTIELVAPDELAITTTRGLDDPDLCMLAWQDGALRRVTLPPDGTPLSIARSPGVLGL